MIKIGLLLRHFFTRMGQFLTRLLDLGTSLLDFGPRLVEFRAACLLGFVTAAVKFFGQLFRKLIDL